MWAEKIAPGSGARLEEAAPPSAAAHTAVVVEAAARTAAAAGTAVEGAAADIAAAHTVVLVEAGARTAAVAGVLVEGAVAEERTAAEALEVAGFVAARRAREVERHSLLHIPAEAVAMEPPAGARASRPPEPPVRRKMGSRSSREEHRVRTADISS